ncbi:MAG: hypothetical protein RLY45_706, partial [Actinomycetota bacterium]
VDAAVVEAALRIAIDAVHAEAEALGIDRGVADVPQGSSVAGSALTVSPPAASVHSEPDGLDVSTPAASPPAAGPDTHADAIEHAIDTDASGRFDDTTPLDDVGQHDDPVDLGVSAHLDVLGGNDDAVGDDYSPDGHGSPELVGAASRNGVEPADDDQAVDDIDDVDDGNAVGGSAADEVDDTWDSLRLPVRPLPVDPDWDDDLPVSAAASAAERAARMHRGEPPAASPAERAAPAPQRASAPVPRPLDLLAERARQRGDIAGDEGSFRIGGDELH